MKENVFRKEFVRSLKIESAEEIVDIYIYRPLGFILAKIFSRTKITPNIITVTGMFWGLLAGYFLSKGTPLTFIYGAIIYQIANIFDCADGQLARLTSRYSDFGRILDGFVDYFNVSAVLIGSFIGLLRSDDPFLRDHHLVAVIFFAALSTAVASALYDKLKSKYMNLVSGKEIVKENKDELREKRAAEPSSVKRFFYSLYIFYLTLQCFISENISLKGKDRRKFAEVDREIYRELYISKNAKLLKVWSLVGPSTHAFYFLIFALLGKFPLYFLFVVGPLNIILLLLFYVQYRTERSILIEMKGKA